MRYLTCLLSTALATTSARAGEDQDKFEEHAVTRVAHIVAERSIRGERGERANTIRDLEAAFPGKLAKTEPGKKESEGEAWFALVAGTGDVWSKADAAAAGLSPMFERWRQRLELGPVPSIKRDEFLKFAKLIIHNAKGMQSEGGEVNVNSEADKAFRVLDLNSDDELTGNEVSTPMRADKALGVGRITKDQYRDYFRRRVEKKTETLAAAIKNNEALMRKLNAEDSDRHTGLPEWFTSLDLDKDKQIALSEWRKGGRPIAEFLEMDLNEDGLLTSSEYLRWMKLKRAEDQRKEEKRQEEEP